MAFYKYFRFQHVYKDRKHAISVLCKLFSIISIICERWAIVYCVIY